MGPILDRKDGMAKAGFSVCRVLGLWLCHAAAQKSEDADQSI